MVEVWHDFPSTAILSSVKAPPSEVSEEVSFSKTWTDATIVVVVCTGISFSDDKLLQTRVFSYTDTQRYRLGVNYQMLPINQPKCPFHNNHFDGQMNFMHKNEEVS